MNTIIIKTKQKPLSPLKKGDLFILLADDGRYKLSSAYILSGIDTHSDGCMYCLINISSGDRWANPTHSIDEVFGYAGASSFRKLENVIITVEEK